MVSMQLIKFYLGKIMGVPHQLYFRRDSIKPRSLITLSFKWFPHLNKAKLYYGPQKDQDMIIQDKSEYVFSQI